MNFFNIKADIALAITLCLFVAWILIEDVRLQKREREYRAIIDRMESDSAKRRRVWAEYNRINACTLVVHTPDGESIDYPKREGRTGTDGNLYIVSCDEPTEGLSGIESGVVLCDMISKGDFIGFSNSLLGAE